MHRLPVILLILLCFFTGCANITSPTGGKKDTIPPKLVSIDPPDSSINKRIDRIEMHFNEYVTVADVAKEVQISPILLIPPTVTGRNKTVIVKIVDSLLENNTTYRLSFGTSIRDLHEGNPFRKYTYTFSTGSYFDSLQLHGNVINAFTGLPDTGSVIVELYKASENDSAVVRHKPRYITKTDASGNYIFRGLPKIPFRVYAVKDLNSNLIYDGPASGELIGFADDTAVVPSDTAQAPVNMSIFMETIDTAMKKIMDSTENKKQIKKPAKTPGTVALAYSLNLDTTNIEKRTFDITGFIWLTFNKQPILNKEKITLTYDSLGITVTPNFTITSDTVTHKIKISSDWRENMEYKLRLVKGFAKDTSGTDVAPSRYSFRTKEDDDYGAVTIKLPAKYDDPKYLLYILADNDSVYLKPITNTTIVLTRLKPAKYTFRIVVDKNRNGKWDTGDLLGKKQPEMVIPYWDVLNIRAGFENTIDDFDKKPAPKQETSKNPTKPE